ncbi:hypothetical protein ACFYUJ_02925 [Streptomyces sp. NPDC004520]|uniref:hypothetical protein n=1 Tax=Streptomyces sp. NPDC004520 TaxID=3364702 RepID=UPI0036CEEC87
MIYRHFNAPSHAFTQFSHDIIRHPRLSSDAVRLLTWQLSLPQGARECLSRTAERARIGSTSFVRAKRQLKEEGFVHERRVQGVNGYWFTQQLVSNVPLTADQAAKLLGREPVPVAAPPASSQVAPSHPEPAVGQPVPPPADGYPESDPAGDTSNLPPEAEEEAEEKEAAAVAVAVAVADSPRLEEGRALIGALPILSPVLRHIPPGMRDELARLATRWLDAGHTPTDIHAHILRGLPGAGTPVHRPGGLLRYLLRDVPPRELTPRPAPGISSRLSGTRECSGDHTQTTLFRPVGDETLCPRCVTD